MKLHKRSLTSKGVIKYTLNMWEFQSRWSIDHLIDMQCQQELLGDIYMEDVQGNCINI